MQPRFKYLSDMSLEKFQQFVSPLNSTMQKPHLVDNWLVLNSKSSLNIWIYRPSIWVEKTRSDVMVDYYSFLLREVNQTDLHYAAAYKRMDNHVIIQHHPYVCPCGPAGFLRNAWQSTFYLNDSGVVDRPTHLFSHNICHTNICHRLLAVDVSFVFILEFRRWIRWVLSSI